MYFKGVVKERRSVCVDIRLLILAFLQVRSNAFCTDRPVTRPGAREQPYSGLILAPVVLNRLLCDRAEHRVTILPVLALAAHGDHVEADQSRVRAHRPDARRRG